MPSSRPVASAIMATYNSAHSLASALDSLLAQSLPIEIIIIDDGSTDNSLDLLSSYSDKIIVLKQDHQGPAIARNLGANSATTPILLFVDADMTFHKHYVRDLIKPIQKREVIGTYAAKELVANWDNPLARCWNIEEGWADKLRFRKNPPKWGTDYRAIKSSEFKRVGGFDNIGYTDTWTLFKKLGKKPLATTATCYHHNPSSYDAVYKQSCWAAKRPYKLGFVGALYAILRASLPVSLVIGIVRSIRRNSPHYLPFKIVYDFGRVTGILEMLLTGNLTK